VAIVARSRQELEISCQSGTPLPAKSVRREINVLARTLPEVGAAPAGHQGLRRTQPRAFARGTALVQEKRMSTITTKDGTTIYYKDWGSGPVVTFSHGWPLNADAWDGEPLRTTGAAMVAPVSPHPATT
jgi:hypothetical protein